MTTALLFRPPPTRKPPARVYERAREALRERGHSRGMYMSYDGRICLMSALAIGCGAETDKDIRDQTHSPTQEMADAMVGLARTINPNHPLLADEDFATRYAHTIICSNNNTPDTDPDDLLQRAAERYRAW